MIGILAGTLFVHANRNRALRRMSVMVDGMLALAVAATYLAWQGWIGVVILSSAMGLLNTSVTQIGGQPVSLGFMTGDLNSLAQQLASGILRSPVPQAQSERDTHWQRAALLGSLWVFFLLGAALGAALAPRVAIWTLLLPAVLLLLLALVGPTTSSAPSS